MFRDESVTKSRLVRSNFACFSPRHRLVSFVALRVVGDVVAAQIDGRSDIWAIGVCVFQLLTGDVPFRAPPGQHRRNIIGEVLYNATAAVR